MNSSILKNILAIYRDSECQAGSVIILSCDLLERLGDACYIHMYTYIAEQVYI